MGALPGEAGWAASSGASGGSEASGASGGRAAATSAMCGGGLDWLRSLRRLSRAAWRRAGEGGREGAAVDCPARRAWQHAERVFQSETREKIGVREFASQSAWAGSNAGRERKPAICTCQRQSQQSRHVPPRRGRLCQQQGAATTPAGKTLSRGMEPAAASPSRTLEDLRVGAGRVLHCLRRLQTPPLPPTPLPHLPAVPALLTGVPSPPCRPRWRARSKPGEPSMQT